MQDFTKDLGIKSTKDTPPASMPASPNDNGWLAKRLNRDNTFNLAFILGVIIGAKVINFWLALGIMALALRFLNPVKFENGKFFSSSGREIDCTNLKYLFGRVFIFIFCSIFLLAFLPFSWVKAILFKSPIFLIFLFSSATFIFFIYNLPLSILLGKNSSIFFKKLDYKSKNYIEETGGSFQRLSNTLSDPSYRALPGNIYHRR